MTFQEFQAIEKAHAAAKKAARQRARKARAQMARMHKAMTR